MTFEKAICFLPSSSYTFHRTPSNRTTAIPSYTHSQHYLSVVSLSISRSPRGAHVLANPNRHVRSFVGGSQLLLRDFVLETPEDCERSTVALPARAHEDHEEVPVAI